MIILYIVVVQEYALLFGGCYCWHFDETEQYDPKMKTGGLYRLREYLPQNEAGSQRLTGDWSSDGVLFRSLASRWLPASF
jgi:hypothetical protein